MVLKSTKSSHVLRSSANETLSLKLKNMEEGFLTSPFYICQ